MIALMLNVGCITTSKNKKNEETMNQLVLQEDLQRFYTRFTERIYFGEGNTPYYSIAFSPLFTAWWTGAYIYKRLTHEKYSDSFNVWRFERSKEKK
jgi:hypothetical protein